MARKRFYKNGTELIHLKLDKDMVSAIVVMQQRKYVKESYSQIVSRCIWSYFVSFAKDVLGLTPEQISILDLQPEFTKTPHIYSNSHKTDELERIKNEQNEKAINEIKSINEFVETKTIKEKPKFRLEDWLE